MANQGYLKALPDPESLALRIATKSAFLASRTAKDAAISTLAQQSAEHTRLQEVHRGLIAQLEQKKNQILDLRDIAAKAQSISTEKELELQLAAESARSALAQEEAEHAHLKERYRDCITELERKDAEIVGLHSKIKALSKKHNDADHAAYVALKEHEVELSHVRIRFEERDAELEEKSSHITELDGTIERLRRECSELKVSEAGLQEALDGRTRDLEHARDAATLSQTQHNAEKRRLQDLLHEQTKQTVAKDIQIFELQETSENLAQENSNLKSQVARVNNALAAITQDLKRVTTDAFTRITASKSAAHQRVAGLMATIEALEKDALRCKKQLGDAAQAQSQTEGKRRDAVDMMLKAQAVSDQLKRDNALLSKEVDNLQARKELLLKQLADVRDAHARRKEELRNATKTVSELRTAKAAAHGGNDVSTPRLQQLALTERVETVMTPSTASRTDRRANAALRLVGQESSYTPHLSPEEIRHRLADIRKAVLAPPRMPYVSHVHSSEVAHPQATSQKIGAKAQGRRMQAVVSPADFEPALESDDSDLYDWATARTTGLFDFWSHHLHGFEIMELIKVTTEPEQMVDWISNLMFDGRTRAVAQWLVRRFADRDDEARRLEVVHLLNHSVGVYGYKHCRRVHIYPDGSHEQDIRVRYALDRLRQSGTLEHVGRLFAASLSCFMGRSCLAYLEECGIFLDHKECELLTQKCRDKRAAR